MSYRIFARKETMSDKPPFEVGEVVLPDFGIHHSGAVDLDADMEYEIVSCERDRTCSGWGVRISEKSFVYSSSWFKKKPKFEIGQPVHWLGDDSDTIIRHVTNCLPTEEYPSGFVVHASGSVIDDSSRFVKAEEPAKEDAKESVYLLIGLIYSPYGDCGGKFKVLNRLSRERLICLLLENWSSFDDLIIFRDGFAVYQDYKGVWDGPEDSPLRQQFADDITSVIEEMRKIQKDRLEREQQLARQNQEFVRRETYEKLKKEFGDVD